MKLQDDFLWGSALEANWYESGYNEDEGGYLWIRITKGMNYGTSSEKSL